MWPASKLLPCNAAIYFVGIVRTLWPLKPLVFPGRRRTGSADIRSVATRRAPLFASVASNVGLASPARRNKGIRGMKKLINNPRSVVEEMPEGFVAQTADLAVLTDETVVVRDPFPRATGGRLLFFRAAAADTSRPMPAMSARGC